jgi:hypothetical protein
MKWITWKAWPQYVNTKTNKQKSSVFDPVAEVTLEVMPKVMSAETTLIKWSEVFFIIVYYDQKAYFKVKVKVKVPTILMKGFVP